mgnify:CR=1 FL=1
MIRIVYVLAGLAAGLGIATATAGDDLFAACPPCPPCAAATPEATQAIEAAKAAIKAATAPPPTVKE